MRMMVWRCLRLASRSPAEAYRLVRAILNTAVDDGRIRRIKGAGEHRTVERPTASVRQVYDLADRMPDRFRALVLVAAFTGLRWGELVGLRRCDLDLTTGTHRRVRHPLRQCHERQLAEPDVRLVKPGGELGEVAAGAVEGTPGTAPLLLARSYRVDVADQGRRSRVRDRPQ